MRTLIIRGLMLSGLSVFDSLRMSIMNYQDEYMQDPVFVYMTHKTLDDLKSDARINKHLTIHDLKEQTIFGCKIIAVEKDQINISHNELILSKFNILEEKFANVLINRSKVYAI